MALNPHARRILMLGASGKLGRMMQAVWEKENGQASEVIPVWRTDAPPGAIAWAPGDAVDRLPRVDSVVALWGVTGSDVAALRANAVLADHAMVLGDALGAESVLHCSSAAVYAPETNMIPESAATAPLGAYGFAKQEMERRVRQATPRARQVLMRIGNVAGAESLFANMALNSTVTLDRFADGGGPARSYVAPHSLARVLAALAQSGAPSGAINVAAPKPISMEAIAKEAGCQIVWRPAPKTAFARLLMDTSLLQSICPIPDAEAKPGYMVESARATGLWP